MILGEVVIRHNGKQLKTKKGSSLNPGGYNYTDHMGPGRSWGPSREYVTPTIQSGDCGGRRCRRVRD
ncbi:phage tail tube protein [Vibrio metschnikovii]